MVRSNFIFGCAVCILFTMISCVLTADESLDEFFSRRSDIPDNISKWSGKTDRVWILREWIKITTERNEDYETARKILAALEGNNQQPDSPAQEPQIQVISTENSTAGYGIEIERVNVSSKSSYWRATQVRHFSPEENKGKHHIYISYSGGNGTAKAVNCNGDTHTIESGGNLPLWKDDLYEISMSDYPSDKVKGIHTRHADEGSERWNSYGHHSFEIEFKLMTNDDPSDGTITPVDGF